MEHLNAAEHLPPVRCPIVIEVDGKLLKAERTSFVEQRGRQMEYQLESGEKMIGRYRWTFP
jgi:hypothetical protein